jgi:uncharacterized protein involved in outer membrane biogenesis
MSEPIPAPAPKAKPRRRWRKWLAIAAATVIALIALVLSLLPWITNQFVRPYIAGQLQAQLDAPVTIERLSLSCFSGLRLESLMIGADDSELVSLSSFTADVKLFPLLAGNIVFNGDVVVDSPKVTVRIDDQGNLQLPLTEPEPAAPPSTKSDQPISLPSIVGKVIVKDLVLVIIDSKRTATLLPITATVALNGTDAPIALAVASANNSMSLDAVVTIARNGVVDPKCMNGKLAYHIDPAFTRELAPLLSALSKTASWDGSLGGDGTLSLDEAQTVTGKGVLAVETKRLLIQQPSGQQIPLDPGQIALTYAVDRKIDGVFTADISVTAPGAKLQVAANGTALPEKQDAVATMTASCDFMELSKRYPGVIGDPSQGMPISRLDASVTATVHHSADATTLSGKVGLTSNDAGTSITADVEADLGAGRYAAKNAAIALPGIAVTANGGVTLVPAEPVNSTSPLAGMKDLSGNVKARIDGAAALAGLRQLLPILPKSLDIAGIVDADVSASSPSPQSVAATAQVSVQSLKIAGITALDGIPVPASVKLALDARLDVAANTLELPIATIDTDFGGIDASRTRIENALDTKPTAKPQIAIAIKAGRLGQALPALSGFHLAGEDIACTVIGSGGADGGSLVVAVKVPTTTVTGAALGKTVTTTLDFGTTIRGESAWQSIHIEALALMAGATVGEHNDKLSVAADAIDIDLAAKTYRVAKFSARLPGLDADMNVDAEDARLKKGSVTASIRLDQALAAASRYLAQPLDFSGSGNIACAMDAEGPFEKVAITKTVTLKDIRLSGSLEQAAAWPMDASLAVRAHANVLDPAASLIAIATIDLTAPGVAIHGEDIGLCADDLLRSLRRLDGASGKLPPASPVSGKLTATVLPKKLCDALRIALGAVSLADDAAAKMNLTLSGTSVDPQVSLHADTPSAVISSKSGASETLSPATFDLVAAMSAASGALMVKEFALVSDLARITGTASAARSGAGLDSLNVDWKGESDLSRILALADRLKLIPAGTVISGGKLDWKLTAQAKNQQIPFELTLSLPDFAYHDAKMNLPKQEVQVLLKGTASDRGNTLALDPASGITAATAQATFSGMVLNALLQPIADKLAVTLNYSPDQVNPVMAAFGAGQLLARKAQHSQLMLSGPLLPGELMPWLSALNTHESEIGFGTLSHSGFVVVGKPLPLRLSDGKFTLDYQCAINDGPSHLKIEALIPKEKSNFDVSLKNITLTNDLAWALAYVNPIFRLGKDGKLNGFASFACVGSWNGPFMPADIKKALGSSPDASGNFSASQVVIKGSPLLESILKGLGNADEGGLAEVSPTDFRVKKGVFDYKNMTVRVSGLNLLFEGSANLVTDALDMSVTAPFPRKLVDKATAKYCPKTLVVPIKGTIANPEVDFGKAIARAAKDAAKEATKELLKDKAGDLLKGLIK